MGQRSLAAGLRWRWSSRLKAGSGHIALLAACMLAGCTSGAGDHRSPPKTAAAPVRITQLYTTTPQVPRGEKALLCYGVENAKTVWLSPPKQEISAALSRCLEVEPSGRTTYTLTAEAADGRQVSQELAIGSGPPRVHIINIDISAPEIPAGGVASICYKVENAQSVRVAPGSFRGPDKHGCTIVNPAKTTTYTVTAFGAGGDTDEEKVTIKVH